MLVRDLNGTTDKSTCDIMSDSLQLNILAWCCIPRKRSKTVGTILLALFHS